MSTPVLTVGGACKRFGAVRALSGVDVELRAGEVHGLIGPNGAGKSTLTGAITGRVTLDRGTISLDGRERAFRHYREALAVGIVAVPQELAVPADLSVAEVVTLGAEPRRLGVVRRGRAREEARRALARLGMERAPDLPMRMLSAPDQKAVVVAQALHREARVVLLDEPTAGLNAEQAERLLALIETLRDHGAAVLYISHRLREVERLCGAVTVLRDGAVVARLARDEIEHERLVGHLAGEQRAPGARSRTAVRGRRRLVVERLAAPGLEPTSFAVGAGETLGLAGLPGSGVEQLFAALAGRRGERRGTVAVDGHAFADAASAVAAGVGYLPPARRDALLAESSGAENVALASLPRVAARGLCWEGRTRRLTRPIAERLGIVATLDRPMRTLSGGNQQRVLFARLLMAEAQVLVLEDPTLGVDVGARAALHELIRRAAADGRAVVVGSSEPEELEELCDRVLVLGGGRVTATLEGEAVREQRIIAAVTGGAEEGAHA